MEAFQRRLQAFVVARQAVEAGGPGEVALNDSIINDKFCLSHWGHLCLSWPRARGMPGARSAAAYPPDERSHRGGGHETPVAGAPDNGRRGDRTAALGSRLPTPGAMGNDKPAGTDGSAVVQLATGGP